ncbi:succinate dehydrogenase/fumarate reductase iron-sulfur subunit [Fuerstiella marisgermanici]|uniref:Fumarate reductase iron-sulfur subunit n=1 Tax=Fuerstiella marisgermanici TaxID=1891926 RepID=A0A1P8WLK3_9PLAN|nr:succinate dehydrogenase/fumarate reductase iron-sulfur subunit [Fuerstiella marisgermanici]APZ94930.1 Fumarate reductase iron-sulfur subunit [Fuerstiella marisgermanici]
MKVLLKIWRQDDRDAAGKLVDYPLDDVDPDMSFLDMLDMLNEQLVRRGERVIEFDNDCREGICGTCGMVINGRPHGPLTATTTCQLHMRTFNDGDTIVIEPFRASSFPLIRDLKVDRSALDRIIQSGAFISTHIGTAPEANSILIAKDAADAAFDAATCIGCGACVAVCKNASAALFTGAKVTHLSNLPQGKIEAQRRVVDMVATMDKEGFGSCTNTEACEAICPQEISTDYIARMNWEYNAAKVRQTGKSS